MKRIYEFLAQLKDNNNREWFNAHKEEYKAAQELFNHFTEMLICRIEAWDEEIKDSALTIKDCTYRIYRDTRFSKDKAPYKTHMGAYICRGGKKSPYAGYYFHLEPNDFITSSVFPDGANCPNGTPDNMAAVGGFLGGPLLAAGLYCPEPKVIASLRDEISVNGDTFLDAIAEAKGFKLEDFDTLKKVPRGFTDAPERWHNMLKHKDFSISTPLPLELLLGGEEALLDYVEARFKTTRQFNRLLNLAVDYAIEEM